MQPPHAIPPHSHAHGKCPITGQTYDWCPKQEDDDRSPCPALNTLANHGYINRNGKNIDPSDLVSAMEKVYGCSSALSRMVVYGGILLLGQFGKLSLLDIGRHNRIEHNASLTKGDANENRDQEYAPDTPNTPLLNKLFHTSQDGCFLSLLDLSRARVDRERACRQAIDGLHQGIARGEMALILNVFGMDKKSPVDHQSTDENHLIPLNVAKTWFRDEMLPRGWKPSRSVGINDLFRDIKKIRSTMEDLRNHSGPSCNSNTSSGAERNGVKSQSPTQGKFRTPALSNLCRSDCASSSSTLVETSTTVANKKYHLRVETTQSSSSHLKMQHRLLEKMRDLKISTSSANGHLMLPHAQHGPLTPTAMLASPSRKSCSFTHPFDISSPLSPTMPLSAH